MEQRRLLRGKIGAMESLGFPKEKIAAARRQLAELTGHAKLKG